MNAPRAADSQTTSRWPERAVWVAFAFGLAMTLLSFRMPLLRDVGGYLTFGAKLADGAVFYRDYFERKTPLLFYMLGWLFRAVGPSLWWARGLVLLHTALASVLLWMIARRLGWAKAWVVALIALYLLFNPVYLGFEVLTEVPVMLAGMAVAWLLLSRAGRISAGRWFATGLFIGIASTSKQVGILLAPAAGLWLVIEEYRRNRITAALIGRLSLLALGVAIPLAGMTLYFWATGNLDAMVHSVWDSTVRHYEGLAFSAWLYSLARDQVARGLVLWLPVCVAGPGIFWRFVRRGDDREAALVLLIVAWSWIPALKRPYEHYVIPYLPHLCLLGAMIWRQWLERYKARWVVGLAALTLLPTARHYALYIVPPLRERVLDQQLAVAQRIRGYLAPGEPLYVLGAEPKYYFLTGHYHPDPYVYNVLLDRNWRPPEELHHALAHTPGLRYVAVVKGDIEPLLQTVEKVRARAHLVFEAHIGNLETVWFYRLPDEWGSPSSLSADRPPR